MVAIKSKFWFIVCLGFMLAFLSGCVPSGLNDSRNIPVPTPKVGDFVYGNLQSAVDETTPAGAFQDFDIPVVHFVYTGVEDIYFVEDLPQSPEQDRNLDEVLLYHNHPELTWYDRLGKTINSMTKGWSQGIFFLLFLVTTVPFWIAIANVVITKSQLTFSEGFEIEDLVSGIKKITFNLVYRVNLTDEEESDAFSQEKVRETLIPYLVDKIVKFAAEWAQSQQSTLDMTRFIRDLDVMFERTGNTQIDDFIRSARLGITVIGLNRGNPVLDASEQNKNRIVDNAKRVKEAKEASGLDEETIRELMRNQTTMEGNDAMAKAIEAAAGVLGGVANAATNAIAAAAMSKGQDRANPENDMGLPEERNRPKHLGDKK